MSAPVRLTVVKKKALTRKVERLLDESLSIVDVASRIDEEHLDYDGIYSLNVSLGLAVEKLREVRDELFPEPLPQDDGQGGDE